MRERKRERERDSTILARHTQDITKPAFGFFSSDSGKLTRCFLAGRYNSLRRSSLCWSSVCLMMSAGMMSSHVFSTQFMRCSSPAVGCGSELSGAVSGFSVLTAAAASLSTAFASFSHSMVEKSATCYRGWKGRKGQKCEKEKQREREREREKERERKPLHLPELREQIIALTRMLLSLSLSALQNVVDIHFLKNTNKMMKKKLTIERRREVCRKCKKKKKASFTTNGEKTSGEIQWGFPR